MHPLTQVLEAAQALGVKNPSNGALKAYIQAYPATRTLTQVTLADFDAYMALFPTPYVK